jgi:hypothetical protein
MDPAGLSHWLKCSPTDRFCCKIMRELLKPPIVWGWEVTYSKIDPKLSFVILKSLYIYYFAKTMYNNKNTDKLLSIETIY